MRWGESFRQVLQSIISLCRPTIHLHLDLTAAASECNLQTIYEPMLFRWRSTSTLFVWQLAGECWWAIKHYLFCWLKTRRAVVHKQSKKYSNFLEKFLCLWKPSKCHYRHHHPSTGKRFSIATPSKWVSFHTCLLCIVFCWFQRFFLCSFEKSKT